jgi:homoserine kinase
MDKVTVRIPATSANLGPGFDCLGVALELHNRVTVVRGGVPVADAMVGAAGDAFFAAAGVRPFDYGWSIAGDIPRSRGLGSSVAVRLGILHGLNELAAQPLDPTALYLLCAHLEGHPDNAAPAAFGGFAAAKSDGSYFRCDIAPGVRFVVLIPQDEVDTDASRTELPETVSRLDAVFNVAQASLITAAFASQRYELLRGSMLDRLHQPYREGRLPHLNRAISAGVEAGALGGYLSGSGSAVACVTIAQHDAVAAAMQSTLPSSRILVLAADNRGAQVEP